MLRSKFSYQHDAGTTRARLTIVPVAWPQAHVPRRALRQVVLVFVRRKSENEEATHECAMMQA